MKLLAIDATTPTATTAVSVNGRVLAQLTLRDGLTHSQNLLVQIDTALAAAQLKVSDLDGIVVANGPGSFTGLRIALATVKGLAHPFNLPLYGVSTLKGLCYHGRHFKGRVLPMLDARRQQVYGALYAHPEMNMVLPEDTYSLSDLIERLVADQEPVLIVGDGAMVHKERLREGFEGRLQGAVIGDAYESLNTACGLLWAYESGHYKEYSYEDLPAEYLRVSQAEREREMKLELELQTKMKEAQPL